ncbi:MAG: hypothetical protein P8L37_08455 [Phycisphaerales bacterium]|nr:hypothetical protein [Phycisphaerales bacterium]
MPYNPNVHVRLTYLLLVGLLSGCSYMNSTYQWMGGFSTDMRVESISIDPVYITTTYTTAICSEGQNVEGEIWLTDIPVADLAAGTVQNGQIIHIELLWSPRPGYTPIDYEAANISVRYIVISSDQFGIYEGGGFGYPLGEPEDGSMVLKIDSAALQLAESTTDFVDLLSPAVLSGTFNGTCDAKLATLIRDATSQIVTNAFDRTMYVKR